MSTSQSSEFMQVVSFVRNARVNLKVSGGIRFAVCVISSSIILVLANFVGFTSVIFESKRIAGPSQIFAIVAPAFWASLLIELYTRTPGSANPGIFKSILFAVTAALIGTVITMMFFFLFLGRSL